MARIPFGYHKRWAHKSAEERRKHAKMMRCSKGAKHARVTQLSTGHFAFMNLCMRYKRQLGRELTPAERAHIRAVHAEEIAASCVGWPWPKKPRREYPEV